MAQAFVSVGSNEGNRLWNISRALAHLSRLCGIRVLQIAPIIETEPLGGPPQGPYLNTVIEIETSLEPRPLLGFLQGIERRLGRQPSSIRWAPRPIDLDILFYENRIMNDPDLIVPHPRMHTRWFVLEPLSQLAPEFIHPVLELSIASLLSCLSPKSRQEASSLKDVG